MAVFTYMSFSGGSVRHPALQAQDERKAVMLLSFLPAEGKKRLLLFPLFQILQMVFCPRQTAV